MKQPLLIYGAGGLGKEILSWVTLLEQFEPVGFIDDGIKKGAVIKGINVLGGLEVIDSIASPMNLVFAVGDPQRKSLLRKNIRSPRITYPVLRHPSAIIQDEQGIGIEEGSVIAAGCVLTTDIRIGCHVLVNLNSTIGHDVEVGSFSSIMTGVNIAGNVKVGDGVLIGSGASIMNNLKIGDSSKIGMGAVVILDVEPGTTAVGVPARKV